MPRVDTPRARPPTLTGKYAPLHKYLEDRYADMVVLSFGQIESLLGFALPESARTKPEWWSADTTPVDPTSCSAAWTLAGRSARPNLFAQNVAFERAATS